MGGAVSIGRFQLAQDPSIIQKREAFLRYRAPGDMLAVFRMGVHYQALHSLTLLGIGLLALQHPSRPLAWSGALISIGMLLLSWLPAGWVGIHLLPALLFIVIGKGARYTLLMAAIPAG